MQASSGLFVGLASTVGQQLQRGYRALSENTSSSFKRPAFQCHSTYCWQNLWRGTGKAGRASTAAELRRTCNVGWVEFGRDVCLSLNFSGCKGQVFAHKGLRLEKVLMQILFSDSSCGFRRPHLGSVLDLERCRSDDLLRTSGDRGRMQEP